MEPCADDAAPCRQQRPAKASKGQRERLSWRTLVPYLLLLGSGASLLRAQEDAGARPDPGSQAEQTAAAALFQASAREFTKLYDEKLFNAAEHAILRVAGPGVRAELAFDPLTDWIGPTVRLPGHCRLAALELSFPKGATPEAVVVSCLDGGLLNGRGDVTLRPQEGAGASRVAIAFNEDPGLARICLEISTPAGKRRMEMNFWIGPAHDPLPEPEGTREAPAAAPNRPRPSFPQDAAPPAPTPKVPL